MARADVFDLDMTLDRIFIRPKEPSVGRVLIFNRDTEGVKVKDYRHIPLHASKRIIFGVVGVIKLILCRYLVVISQRSRVDPDIRLHHSLWGVWRVDKVNLIPLAPGRRELTRKQREANEEYILMVLSALNTKDLYYSNTIDLSCRRSDMENAENEDDDKNAFIFNSDLLGDMKQIKGSDSFCINLVSGFIQVKYAKYQSEMVVIALLSRRRNKRVGSRFFTTGIDNEGEAANCVETELILEGSNIVSSYTILSGSVPLLWDQWPDLSCNPRPLLSKPDSQFLPFAKHFEDLAKRYGDLLVAIDLSKYCAWGKSIHEYYKDLAMNLESLRIKYVEFNLKVTLRKEFNDTLLADIKQMGFTWLQNDILIAKQKGVIRVSSINYSDYTHIVQSILVGIVLPTMLKTTMGTDIFKTPTDFELKALQKTYNNLWLEQGDVLAYHYVGTHATNAHLLDRDRGRIYEFWIPLQRWYINNFEDGFKQDSFDLILGNYKVRSKKSYPMVSNMEKLKMILNHYILPGTIMFSSILVINLITEFNDEFLYHEDEKCVLVWSFAVVVLWIWFYSNVQQYADEPRLYVKKPH